MNDLLPLLHYCINGALVLQWDGILLSCYVSTAVIKVESSPLGNGSCEAGYYFSESQSHSCRGCTNCTMLHKQKLSPCNKTQDSMCGSCLPGYFLSGVSDSATECQRCSRCPPEDDGTAVRWKDCQRAGLDRDMWCSPGYIEPETLEPEPASSQSQTSEAGPILGSDSFLEYPNGISDSNPAELSATVLIVGAVCCLSLAGVMCTCITVSLCHVKLCRSTSVPPYHHIAVHPQTLVQTPTELDLKGVT